MVDKDAGELVADRLVDQQCGDRGINAARKRADDLALADLLADRLDRVLAVGAHRPVALDAGGLVDEVLQQPGAVRRMHHFGVEHDAVHLALDIAEDGEGRAFRFAEHLEPLGQGDDAVAVAHPHLMALAGRPQALEQRAVLLDLDEGAAEFAMVGAFGDAAHLHAHRHLAIADAEHRHTGIEDDLRRARAADVAGRGRAAGEDHRFRIDALERRFGRLERHDLGKHAGLADAPGDELRELAAEIDNQDGVGQDGVGTIGYLHGERLEKETSRRNGLKGVSLNPIPRLHAMVQTAARRTRSPVPAA
ncbi:hypothetical protein MES5069_360093 [Mesorhizobium escarrei]|uniref:Uncharacterized protein n=1 Tax=Mesorhizobium escarrei TaxID=666018 RepID=A0ABM9E1M1_9HYPH|nr:hypothetical protein MES5069_360093 [Mesorhizobium escarrei]